MAILSVAPELKTDKQESCQRHAKNTAKGVMVNDA